MAEVVVWLLFVALLAPAAFTGWAIGHYTAGGRTVTRTVTVGAATTAAQTSTATATTAAATTTAAARTTPTTTSTTTAAAASGGNPARGKQVFASSGCAACHTFKPAGATGTIGPDLDTRPAADAQKAKMPLAAFVRESIVAPDAFIPSGYQKGVMPTTFSHTLGKSQLADLVSFIVGSRK